MEFPLLSSLLKKMMKELNLKQADLALVLGVPLDRVKSLTSGKVKRMTREEAASLVKQLRIRDDWLISGEGPMLQSVDSGGETDDEFSARHDRIRRMQELVNSMPLSEHTKLRLRALMQGDPAHDGPLIAQALQADAMGLDFGTGKPIPGAVPPPMPMLSPRTAALVDNYEHASEEGKKIIEGTASMAAQRPAKSA